MRGKFQMMFIQYGELPNQQSYQKEALESYIGEIFQTLKNH